MAKIAGQDRGKKIAALLLVVAASVFGLREITTRIMRTPAPVQIEQKEEQKATPLPVEQINAKTKDRITGLEKIRKLSEQLEKIIAETKKLIDKRKYEEAVNMIQKSYDVEKQIDETRELLYNKHLIDSWETFEIGDKISNIKSKLNPLIELIKDNISIKDTSYINRYLRDPGDTVSLLISVCQKIFNFSPMIGDFNSNINIKRNNGSNDKLKFEYHDKNHTFYVDRGQIKNPNIMITMTENIAKTFLFSKEPNEQLRAALKNGMIRYEINKKWLVEHGKDVMNTNLDLMVGHAKSLIGNFTANLQFKRLNNNIDKIKLVFEDEKIKVLDYGTLEDSDIDIFVDERTVIDILLSKTPNEIFKQSLKSGGIKYLVNSLWLNVKVKIAMAFLIGD